MIESDQGRLNSFKSKREAVKWAAENYDTSDADIEGGVPASLQGMVDNAVGETPNFEGSLPGPGSNKNPMDRLKELQGSPTSGGSEKLDPSGNAATPGVDAPDVPDVPGGSSGGAARTIVLTILGILAAFAWGSR